MRRNEVNKGGKMYAPKEAVTSTREGRKWKKKIFMCGTGVVGKASRTLGEKGLEVFTHLLKQSRTAEKKHTRGIIKNEGDLRIDDLSPIVGDFFRSLMRNEWGTMRAGWK